MQFCRKYNLHLVSDEIYALSVFNSTAPPVPFTSVLSIDSAGLIDPEYLHVFYGMSKVFYPTLETPLPKAKPTAQGFWRRRVTIGLPDNAQQAAFKRIQRPLVGFTVLPALGRKLT